MILSSTTATTLSNATAVAAPGTATLGAPNARKRALTRPLAHRLGATTNPALPVAQGPQGDAGWLWRCIDVASRAGYDEGKATFLGRGMRHVDAYRVPSATTANLFYRVTYTPSGPAFASIINDGVWQCQCAAAKVGSPCKHIGAAYLLACARDASRHEAEQIIRVRIARTQRTARDLEDNTADLIRTYLRMADRDGWDDPAVMRLDETIRYFQQRYQALLNQMTADRAELVRRMGVTYSGVAGVASAAQIAPVAQVAPVTH